MREINFNVYVCGMSGDYFSDKVKIYKPHGSFGQKFVFHDDNADIKMLSDLIQTFKEEHKDHLGEWGSENLSIDHIYIRTEDALFGLTEDKKISDVFDFFKQDKIEIVYFMVLGGASLHCNGYTFIVHPNEDIHKNTPHVHVRRDDDETRYSLDTLERFPDDKVSRRFLKDEKKIIKNYLQNNRERLYRYWKMYMNGYIPPLEDAVGNQFYQES